MINYYDYLFVYLSYYYYYYYLFLWRVLSLLALSLLLLFVLLSLYYNHLMLLVLFLLLLLFSSLLGSVRLSFTIIDYFRALAHITFSSHAPSPCIPGPGLFSCLQYLWPLYICPQRDASGDSRYDTATRPWLSMVWFTSSSHVMPGVRDLYSSFQREQVRDLKQIYLTLLALQKHLQICPSDLSGDAAQIAGIK